jgi:hypothetical protein
MKIFEVTLLAILIFLFSFWIGRGAAHHEIKLECQRLGGFYVGAATFKCAEVTTENEDK